MRRVLTCTRGIAYGIQDDWEQARKSIGLCLTGAPQAEIEGYIKLTQEIMLEHPNSVALQKALQMLQDARKH